MFTTFRNAWKVEELRKKLIYTMLVLVVFRLACCMPVPFISSAALTSLLGEGGSLLDIMDMFSGGAFSQATLGALGVQPYINASIIIQLLTVAIPALENLAKEGEEGRRKLTRITRYTGAGFAVALSFGYYWLLRSQGVLSHTDGFSGVFAAIVIVLSFAAGSMFIQWLGEQIDQKGIGNGISLLIFAGIVSRFGSMFSTVRTYFLLGMAGMTKYFFFLPMLAVLALVVIVLIVILNAAERRIPVQYAKRVVGRKMYGGQSSYLPIKVNMSGVMPIIFASALLSIPSTIGTFLPGLNNQTEHPIWYGFFHMFSTSSWFYAALYFILIILFNYFYVGMQYNPIELANNLRNNNGAIPGYRPGKPTSDFIAKVLGKITFTGALFLGVVASLPTIIGMITGMPVSLGGTSLLIVVGVALDTSRSLESYMLMRHHKGFLE